ncbi:restriction endonuclease [Longispora sp. K20-0274]|uniref:restriction endonuclease n=1 Tax=Longispora sp. K20-0274 TaxID=3088255 RepID=UPI003999A007
MEQSNIPQPTGEPAEVKLGPAQVAAAAQRRWAAEYSTRHRTRRGTAWLVAVTLATVAGVGMASAFTPAPVWVRVAGAVMFSSGSLVEIKLAASENRAGYQDPKDWVAGWAFMLFWAVLACAALVSHGHAGQGWVTFGCGLAALIVLTVGLRIPACPHVDWTLANLDYLMNVNTRRASTNDVAPPVGDYRHAEEIAAAWLRRFGFTDAEATPVGPDDGVDVIAAGAVAQVKLWKTKNVGIKDVQRIAGAARSGQARIFFAARGYTKPAIKWANDPENRVALFILEDDGHLFARNHHAADILLRTRQRLPAASRAPMKAWMKVSAAVVFLFGFLVFSGALLAVLLAPTAPSGEAIAILTLFWLLQGLSFLLAVGKDIRRLLRNVRDGERGSRWPGWRNLVVDDPVDGRDAGLASDLYVGHEPSLLLRIVRFIGTSDRLRRRTARRIKIARAK